MQVGQEREGDVDVGCGRMEGEKWSDLGFILQVNLTDLLVDLDLIWREGKEESRMTPRLFPFPE